MANMLKIYIVLLVAIFLAACDSVEMDIANEKAIIEARGKALATAEAARDIETAMSFWAEDAIIQVYGSVQQQGKDSIRKGMQEFFTAFTRFEGNATHIEVATSGDLAYEYGVNRVVLQGEETEMLAIAKYLAIWRKIDGTWLISAISITDDAASPVPL
ncbi:MAG: nuclear transport factor 2 family protein [Oceanicoccus sp.]